MVCFNFGNVSSNAFGSHPTISQDIAEKDVKETRDVKSKISKITYNGMDYALNQRTNELFNYKDAEQNEFDTSQISAIGKIMGKGKTMKVELL